VLLMMGGGTTWNM